MQNEEDAYRKIRLRVEDVQGRNCLTNFWVSSACRKAMKLCDGMGKPGVRWEAGAPLLEGISSGAASFFAAGQQWGCMLCTASRSRQLVSDSSMH